MRAALLVIDAQNEYFAPQGKWVLPDGEQALAEIHRLLDAARQAGMPVFHIVHERLAPASPVFVPGTPGVAIHSSIAVLPDERVVRKHFPGSFTQTALEAYLRLAGVDTVIIAGFMTQVCCDTTTRQARERGFQVLFISDATAARDQQVNGRTVPHHVIHEATLAVLETQFGARVVTTAEVLVEIRA